MSDVDRAVPVVPEKSPAAPRRRPRFRLPGWTMLVVLVAAIGAFAYFSSVDAVPVEPVDVTSWVCPEEVEEKQQWQYYLDAGCREEPVDTTITLMHLAGELDTRTTASGTAHFDRVAVKSIELAFRIDTAEPRQAMVLFDLAEDPPQHLYSFTPDRARERWTGPFRPSGHQQFALLHGPVVEP